METLAVRVISRKVIREFGKKHSDAGASLNAWYRIVKAADWKAPAELLRDVRGADVVGDKVVFNIAENKYRLIAFVKYPARIVYIKAILTHKEYDKERWK